MPVDLKRSIEEELGEDNLDGAGYSSQNINISRRASEEVVGEPDSLDDVKPAFRLFHTFQLPAQSGITTIAKLGATESTGPRLLLACRNGSVHCVYFLISASPDGGGFCTILPRMRKITAIPVQKPWNICALSCIRVESEGETVDFIASIRHNSNNSTGDDQPSPCILTVLSAKADDVCLDNPNYQVGELLIPPYGCNPIIWRNFGNDIRSGFADQLTIMVPNQDAGVYCFPISPESTEMNTCDPSSLPEADYSSDKPIAAIEFWDTVDSRITAVARGCHSRIQLTQFDFKSREKTVLWETQHDSLTQKLRFFGIDAENQKMGLLVLGLGELAIIYLDVVASARPKSITLPGSNSHDLVTCGDIADIDGDSFQEIVLGTYGKVALLYKLIGEEVSLLHIVEVASPIYFVSFTKMTKTRNNEDETLNFLIVTQKCIHVYSLE